MRLNNFLIEKMITDVKLGIPDEEIATKYYCSVKTIYRIKHLIASFSSGEITHILNREWYDCQLSTPMEKYAAEVLNGTWVSPNFPQYAPKSEPETVETVETTETTETTETVETAEPDTDKPTDITLADLAKLNLRYIAENEKLNRQLTEYIAQLSVLIANIYANVNSGIRFQTPPQNLYLSKNDAKENK